MWERKRGESLVLTALSFMFNRGTIISGREEEGRDGDLVTTRTTDMIDVFNNLWLLFFFLLSSRICCY